MSILHADGLVFGKNLWVLWHCTLISVWYGELVSELLKKKKMFFFVYLGQKFNYPADEWTFKICNFLQPISLLSPAWFRFFAASSRRTKKVSFQPSKKNINSVFCYILPSTFFSKVTFYLYQLSNNVSSGLKKVLFSTLKNKKVH